MHKLSLHSLATGIAQFCKTTVALPQPVLHSFYIYIKLTVGNWFCTFLDILQFCNWFFTMFKDIFQAILPAIFQSFKTNFEQFSNRFRTVSQQRLHSFTTGYALFCKGFSHFYTTCFAYFLNRISLLFVYPFGHFATFFNRFCTFCIF